MSINATYSLLLSCYRRFCRENWQLALFKFDSWVKNFALLFLTTLWIYIYICRIAAYKAHCTSAEAYWEQVSHAWDICGLRYLWISVSVLDVEWYWLCKADTTVAQCSVYKILAPTYVFFSKKWLNVNDKPNRIHARANYLGQTVFPYSTSVNEVILGNKEVFKIREDRSDQ